MHSNKKQILVNAIMLFVRMGIMLVVALYTSRIVLQQLGIADFGIYNVVAGIVMLMGFFNGSLAQGVQRFLIIIFGTRMILKH